MPNCTNLTLGRKLPCRTGSGGLRAISFAPWSVDTVMTGTTQEIAVISSAITNVYRYEVKNSGNAYTETIAGDADTRSVLYNGELAVVLQKLDKETTNEIKMLGMGELVIFLEDYNGHVYVIGNGTGALLTAGTIVSGGARADMQGYNLTFSTSEVEPYWTLSEAAEAQYKALWVEGT